MKKIYFILFIFFISFIFSADDIDIFINKANKIANKIDSVQKSYNKIYEVYNNIIKKVESVKAEINNSSGINKSLKSILLNYYLFRGNNAAYNISILKNKLKELKDDYFTYIVLIIDEYNKKIQKCINEKCAMDLLEIIYFERKKWLAFIKDYEEILSISELIPVLYISKDKEVKEDIKNYFEKKLIQINQIILIFNEEKEIERKVIKYGFKIEQGKIFDIENKIKSLNIKKAEIEKQLKINNIKYKN